MGVARFGRGPRRNLLHAAGFILLASRCWLHPSIKAPAPVSRSAGSTPVWRSALLIAVLLISNLPVPQRKKAHRYVDL
jgi:hypothetical protein